MSDTVECGRCGREIAENQASWVGREPLCPECWISGG